MGENRKTDLIQEKGTYVKIRYCLRTAEGEYIKGDPREGLAILEIFTGYNQLHSGPREATRGIEGRREDAAQALSG